MNISIIDNFTNVPVSSVNGKEFTVESDKDVDFNKEAVYVNVQQEQGILTSRGGIYHRLKFVKKEKLAEGRYIYTFENVSETGRDIVEYVESLHGREPRKVTIQPWNIFPAKFLASLDSHRQLTFSVTDSSLFKQGETYVIRSYCLDNYVKGTGNCITARHDTGNGDIVTFELNEKNYNKFSTKGHCRFSFSKETWNPFETKVWLQFKKSKSVKSLKKRAKTPKRSKARKNVNSLKKHAKTPKRSKALKSLKIQRK